MDAMDTVERIRFLAMSRGIRIYKMERDLGFGNGYFCSLKRGDVPASRLSAIAEYFGVSTKYLLNEPDEQGMTFDDWYDLGHAFGTIAKSKGLMESPDVINDKRLGWFFQSLGPLSPYELRKAEELVGYTVEQLAPKYAERLHTADASTDTELKAAFFGGYADGLTQEEKDGLWRDAQDFARFKAEQLRKEKQRGK